MNNYEERNFTDHAYDKRYGETYDEASRRHAMEAADASEMFNPKTTDSGTSMFIPYTPTGPRKKAAKWAIGFGWLLMFAYLFLWVGLVDFGSTQIYGYDTQTVLCYSGLGALLIGYFGEWIGYLLFVLGAYILYSAFTDSAESMIEQFVIGVVIILLGGIFTVVFGRK